MRMLLWGIGLAFGVSSAAMAEQWQQDRSGKDINLAQLADEIEEGIGDRLRMGLNASTWQVDDWERLNPAQQRQVLQLYQNHVAQPEARYIVKAMRDKQARIASGNAKLKALGLTEEELAAMRGR